MLYEIIYLFIYFKKHSVLISAFPRSIKWIYVLINTICVKCADFQIQQEMGMVQATGFFRSQKIVYFNTVKCLIRCYLITFLNFSKSLLYYEFFVFFVLYSNIACTFQDCTFDSVFPNPVVDSFLSSISLDLCWLKISPDNLNKPNKNIGVTAVGLNVRSSLGLI